MQIRHLSNLGYWSKEIYNRFCHYKEKSLPIDCEEKPLDLVLLIDTSGKQANRLGDKKTVLKKFIFNLINQFKDKTKLRLSVCLFGNYRDGQTLPLFSFDDTLSEKNVAEKLKDFKW